MAVAKIIEISSSSSKSFEDAIATGIARAAETVHGIQGAWVSEQKVRIENDHIVEWRVMMKVTFLVGA